MEAQMAAGGNPLGSDRIGKLIGKFAVPAIIGMLVNALYNIVDQIFIGQGIGMLGIAATNVAFPLTTISTATALLLGVGGASNFNLKLGAGQKEDAGGIAGNSLSLLALFGLGIGALSMICIRPLLSLFGATEQIMPYALPYTIIIAAGVPFGIFTTGAFHLIRADGSPTYSMICMISGAVFNVIFDPIFLFVFDMGIAGIALATTLGQVLTTGIALFYFLKKYKSVPLTAKCLRPRAKYAGMICSLGAAACINQLAMTVVQIAMNNSLRYYGALSVYGSEIPLACVGAIAKLNIVFMAFTIGIAQGCQPIIGFNFGAKNYDRVKRTYRTAVIAATSASICAFLVFQLFPRQVISIFGNGSEEYFAFAVMYLRTYMLMTFANGIQPVTSNFFTSIGKARVGIILSMTRQIIFLLPLIVLLPLVFGIHGVMYAGPIADAAAVLLSAFFIVREMRRLTALRQERVAAEALLDQPAP